MIEYFTIARELMNRDNKLHYELFDFKQNHDIKLFVAILSNATMIYKNNKTDENYLTFSLKNFFASDSYLCRATLSFIYIEKFLRTNEIIMSKFFDFIDYDLENKTISFTFTENYIKTMKKSGFNKLELKTLKSIKDIRTTKLAMILSMKPKGYLDVNYLFKVLDLYKIERRDRRIFKIKQAFKSLNVDVEYKYPKNKNSPVLEEHYKFYY